MTDADRAAIEAVEDACHTLLTALTAAAERNIECDIDVDLIRSGTVGSADTKMLYNVISGYSRTTVETFDPHGRPAVDPYGKFDATTGCWTRPLRMSPGETVNLSR